MATIMEHTGSVSKTDLKDDWIKYLTVGRKYHYSVKNTEDHGKFNFVVRQEIWDYREEEEDSYTEKLVKITVKPSKTKTGTFTVKDSVLGIPGTKEARVEIIIKYVLTIYNANYTFKIWDDLPTATVSDS